MAHYLLQISYTPETWAVLIQNPQDRAQAVESAVKKLGGTMERFWLSFGNYDVIGVVEMPDSVAAAAFAMAIAAGGACKDVKTTPLLSVQEGMEAMKKAATCGYQAATSSGRR
ncbi:MAG: hypothetical protein JWO80_3857 [Bryobacterales bacterium]|nr:hypothetical protein [Bryobacterales bacterium]